MHLHVNFELIYPYLQYVCDDLGRESMGEGDRLLGAALELGEAVDEEAHVRQQAAVLCQQLIGPRLNSDKNGQRLRLDVNIIIL